MAGPGPPLPLSAVVSTISEPVTRKSVLWRVSARKQEIGAA
jgi:hypothetical protein